MGWHVAPVASRRPAVGVLMVFDAFFEMLPVSDDGTEVVHTQVFTTCADNQRVVEIRIAQRSPGSATAELLGTFELVGIRPAPVATPQIAVTFTINRNDVLHVEAVDRSSGLAQRIAVRREENRGAFRRFA